jgi:hypothetical protein
MPQTAATLVAILTTQLRVLPSVHITQTVLMMKIGPLAQRMNFNVHA